MAVTETVKLIIAIAVGAALLYGGTTVLSWREAAKQNEQRGGTLEATSGIIKDGDHADQARAEVADGVSAGRNQFNTNYDEATAHEPETLSRAARPVPDSVRNAFRARRLARERLGCPGQQCEPRPAPDEAPERP